MPLCPTLDSIIVYSIPALGVSGETFKEVRGEKVHTICRNFVSVVQKTGKY